MASPELNQNNINVTATRKEYEHDQTQTVALGHFVVGELYVSITHLVELHECVLDGRREKLFQKSFGRQNSVLQTKRTQ